MVIKTGDILRLWNKEKRRGDIDYRVGEFGFEVSEETGKLWAYVEMEDVTTKKVHKQPIWMILDMLQYSQLYEPKHEQMVEHYHSAKRIEKIVKDTAEETAKIVGVDMKDMAKYMMDKKK